MYRLMACSAICAVCLPAQTPVNPKEAAEQKALAVRIGDVAEFGPVGITTALAGPVAAVAGAPYSAQAVTERVQVLADGNRIVQSSTGSVARDGQGRVRRDESLPAFSSNKGDVPHIVFIEDPVAGVHWNLDARTKTAMKIPVAQGPSAKRAGEAAALVAGLPPLPPNAHAKTLFFSSTVTTEGGVQVVTRGQGSPNAQVNKADLGVQTVEGVKAQGTRVTRTIPAGEVGNEQPLAITTETWYSPELKVLVMSKTSDPRMGETTYRLTEIQRSEPSAELFEVPADYTVKEGPINNIMYRDVKKND